MSSRDIINPRMIAALGGFAPNTVTIQENTAAGDSIGQPVASWSNISGMVDLECRIDPAKGREIKRENGTVAIVTHKIMIFGSYPVITQLNRAVIGGKNYDILVPKDNAELTHTVLEVELIE